MNALQTASLILAVVSLELCWHNSAASNSKLPRNEYEGHRQDTPAFGLNDSENEHRLQQALPQANPPAAENLENRAKRSSDWIRHAHRQSNGYEWWDAVIKAASKPRVLGGGGGIGRRRRRSTCGWETETFLTMDQDNDGQLSVDEFAQAHGVNPEQSLQLFESLDRNGDEYLQPEEIHSCLA